jgi:hypothetical protein
LRHFRKLTRLDYGEITQPSDPVPLGEHPPIEDFAEKELVLEYGYHEPILA